MNKHIRTDLALELREDIEDKSLNNGIEIEKRDIFDGNIKETIIRIIDSTGERLLGKPKGIYITIEGDELKYDDENIHKKFCECLNINLRNLIGSSKRILVVGLGNRMVTPDALGPFVVDNLYITRHLLNEGLLKDDIDISAICPGVMAQTGIETSDIIKAVCKKVKPDIVIAIDALAAREPSRLGRTIQICDTGISPGSGVGNERSRLDYNTLGVKVISIGVPTVISVPAIVNQALEEMISIFSELMKNKFEFSDNDKLKLSCELLSDDLITMFVTPKNIDESVKRVSYTISEAINSFIEL